MPQAKACSVLPPSATTAVMSPSWCVAGKSIGIFGLPTIFKFRLNAVAMPWRTSSWSPTAIYAWFCQEFTSRDRLLLAFLPPDTKLPTVRLRK